VPEQRGRPRLTWPLISRRFGPFGDVPRQRNVRFGSLADICGATEHVRFTPNSDHKSGHAPRKWSCLLYLRKRTGLPNNLMLGSSANQQQDYPKRTGIPTRLER
jgi:hypothetical protein